MLRSPSNPLDRLRKGEEDEQMVGVIRVWWSRQLVEREAVSRTVSWRRTEPREAWEGGSGGPGESEPRPLPAPAVKEEN